MTPEEYQAKIEKLTKEVEYWKKAFHKAQQEADMLSLDLGIKNNPQWKDISSGG